MTKQIHQPGWRPPFQSLQRFGAVQFSIENKQSVDQ